jgi:ATP-dependent DNA helicase RecG
MGAGVQIQLSDYPREAVRELVVNAFLHRSYETNGTVDVEHSPERLTVVSPGGLVPGVTPENILTVAPTPRNRLLAEVVAALQVAERTGQGVDRAYREMLRVGKEPPAFLDDLTSVRVLLPGGIGNDAFVRFLSDLPENLSRDVDVLLTLSLLRSRNSVDANVLAKVIQRTPAEAQSDCLARLADEHKLLEPTRRTLRKPFPSYRLRSETLAVMARAVSYRRRGVDDIDTKVIEHVREYGSVSNRTIQLTFDLHVFAARDVIADLRARGILAKIGDARGGSNVRYGTGRAPSSRRKSGLDGQHRGRPGRRRPAGCRCVRPDDR